MKPVIAIIGRPNVGKSTLFNRLHRRGKAIVIDEPGATRDRNYADCNWLDHPFILIDTGGFEPASTTEILTQMREQTLLAIEEADLIIFLMDSRDGLAPADQEIAKLLRTTDKLVFYAVNKIDGPRYETLLADFYRLGIGQLYAVSAQHGVGIDELMDEVVKFIPKGTELPPSDEDVIRIAVIGKPNAGKSSLVNRILGYERTIVNPLPGTTRDAIDTEFTRNGRKYLLIDTAGIRRKSRISLNLEKYSIVQAIKAIERADIALLMIDAVDGISDQELKIAGLVLERGTACIIVVNKWDTIKKDNSSVPEYTEDIRYKAKFLDFAPIIFVSATSGQRVEKIFPLVEKIYAQYSQRVETGELNRKMRQIIDMHPPPGMGDQPRLFKYITQVAVKPPTFILFLQNKGSLHFSYERYLVNRIRETFGFSEIPIRLYFRKKDA
ncbi:MAG: ribosome biogenesis GTPase Der [Syntrophobacterales bacterium]|nr:ribosome biogenesis GTPase Der [Syntrophobacterales bacterium]